MKLTDELITCKCGCKCPNLTPGFLPVCPMCQYGHHDGKIGTNPTLKPAGVTPKRCEVCAGTGGFEAHPCQRCNGTGGYMIYTGRQ